MNETKKTGVFFGIAAVVLAIAAFVAWPSSSNDSEGYAGIQINTPLFPDFKDPLVASSLKIVTFNESQGELKNFEVRKDSETGLWTIPSKGGYPADAVEQMRDAANSLVDLSILDSPTDNPEDHPGMGVVEPKLEDLEPGDEGVGRLVTLKDKSQKAIASLIIGNKVKDQEGQVYVRKPGQDPVYVVALDDKPLSTKFDDWIEEDLLQLSSIDLSDVELQDYNASVGLDPRTMKPAFSLKRNYSASFSKEGSTWELASMKEFDNSAGMPIEKDVEVDAEKQLNTQKLNDLANALDDLKFVDVKRKPDGISANLRAEKELVTDSEAFTELTGRGFIPISSGPGTPTEIMSANGEVTATTKEGVKYILRFGNISGISDDDGEEEKTSEDAPGSTGGVNRYLMVSTVVDESKFPVPDLTPIPNTLEELDALDKPAPPAKIELSPELNAPEVNELEKGEPEDTEPEMKEAETGDASAEATETAEPAAEEPAAEEPAAEPKAKDSEPKDGAAAADESKADSGETDADGEGESTTVGEGQEPDQGTDETTENSKSEGQPDASTAKPATADAQAKPGPAVEAGTVETEEEMKADSVVEPAETQEEKEERLAAVQEKIQKENDRKMEERKEKLEQAGILSKALNERFADWYYVIPEDTYSKLRIGRDELFESKDAAAAPSPAGMPPGFGMPQGFPQGIPGN